MYEFQTIVGSSVAIVGLYLVIHFRRLLRESAGDEQTTLDEFGRGFVQ